MANSFTKTYSRLRRVETFLHDTPQKIAARELGDARRWVEIVAINGLVPPYLTDDITQVATGVLLTGDDIQIPDDGAVATSDSSTDPAVVFGTDLLLTDGDLSVDGDGDFASVAGEPNFIQALKNRLGTPLGTLLYHLGYGNPAFAMVGGQGTPAEVSLANALSQRCVQADNRVSSTENFTTTLVGDTLSTKGSVIAVDGTPVDVQT